MATTKDSALQARLEWEQAVDELTEAACAWGAHLERLNSRSAVADAFVSERGGLVVRTRLMNAAARYHAARKARLGASA